MLFLELVLELHDYHIKHDGVKAWHPTQIMEVIGIRYDYANVHTIAQIYVIYIFGDIYICLLNTIAS